MSVRALWERHSKSIMEFDTKNLKFPHINGAHVPLYAAAAVAFYVVWNLLAMLRYYFIAKRHARGKIPVLMTPFSEQNIFFRIFGDTIQIFFAKLEKRLPNWFVRILRDRFHFLLHNVTGIIGRAWEFYDRGETFKMLGKPAFFQVNPRGIMLYVADPVTTRAIFTKKDVGRYDDMYQVLSLYGHSLLTVSGTAWAHHRRITAPPFNEQNSNLVWTEALRQGEDWLKKFNADCDINSAAEVAQACNEFTAKVLLAGGMGIPPSRSSVVPSGHKFSYFDAAQIAIENIIPIALLPTWMLSSRLSSAKKEFGRNIDSLIESEQAGQNSSEKGDSWTRVAKASLLSVLVRENERAKQEPQPADNLKSDLRRRHIGLSNSELRGNMFAFTIAGFDTTSGVINSTLYALAIRPDVQSWVREELRRVIPSGGGSAWDYVERFPQLKRVHALMYEGLRVYHPLFPVPRKSPKYPMELKVAKSMDSLVARDDVEISVPPETYMQPCFNTQSVLPQLWGEDALEWRPQRWIDETTEELKAIPDYFIPWTVGPRACPGLKFSRVEFAGLLSRLLYDHEVVAVKSMHETPEQVYKRIDAVLIDRDVGATTRMAKPEEVGIRFVKL